MEILGVDRKSPPVKKLFEDFDKRAVSPERVAAKILKGIERNRYMVFTSADMRILYWFQRKFALPYEMTMRSLNDRLAAVADRD